MMIRRTGLLLKALSKISTPPLISLHNQQSRFFSTSGHHDSSTPSHLILTASGPDQVGLMSRISGAISKHGGNIEGGRMTRLGSHFCIMLLFTIKDIHQGKPIQDNLKGIEGLDVRIQETQPVASTHTQGFVRQRQVNLLGADEPGILHQVTNYWAENGINIDDMKTVSELAPFSHTPIFRMNATISLPKHISAKRMENEIKALAEKLGVDMWVESFDKDED